MSKADRTVGAAPPPPCDSTNQPVKAAGIIGKPGFRSGARTAPGGRGRSGPRGRSAGPDQDVRGPARWLPCC